ncbi:MAG: branched-chain amino acid aminotransferase [Candidatus Sericytochromatia bacterium]|nr:branched-chain amino acid aminotransferase [Candidatus Sericytochromatia bacterium]
MQLHILTDPATTPLGLDVDPGFGECFTPGMILRDYEPGLGWQDARLVPRAPLSIDPAAVALHYGQSIFEGMKAYRDTRGELVLFRPEANAERMTLSAERMAMPPIPVAEFTELVKAFVAHQGACLSDDPSHALYLRPITFGTDGVLGVHPSKAYTFVLLGMIVSSYFKKGSKGLRLRVEDQYVRAVKGGTGAAKTAGNYAASLLAQRKAVEAGCDQVLWLDAQHREYIEELGGMNCFTVLDGTLVTPPLGDTILAGITRDTLLALARHLGIPTEERPLPLSEVLDGISSGRTTEVFATGTAAVISSVAELVWKGETFRLPDAQPIATMLKAKLTGIQKGTEPDTMHWLTHAQPTALV